MILKALAILLALSPAMAQSVTMPAATSTLVGSLSTEPTLNDLPTILRKLRGCQTTAGLLTVCRVSDNDLWVSVSGDSGLALFRHKDYGDTTYAHGSTVSELLRDFASHLNNERASDKAMLDAMAPYLPSQ